MFSCLFYSATYKAGLRLWRLRISALAGNYERKLKQQPVPTDEEKFRKELEKEKMAPAYRDRLLELLPGMFRKWEPISASAATR